MKYNFRIKKLEQNIIICNDIGTPQFRFPKSPEQQICWIESMGLDNFVFTKNIKLCSDHFEEGCLQKDGNLVKLKSGSIPNLFSACKLACAY